MLRLTGLGLTLAPLPFAMSALVGSGHRWPDLLAQFTAPAALAAGATLLLMMALRMWVRTLAAGAVAGLALAAVWPQWFPPGPPPDPETAVIRLYSANVHHENDQVDAMRASIMEADPDIIVLIELGDAPLARLEPLLAGYPHKTGAVMTTRRGYARSAIASRWPITPVRDRPDGLADVAAIVDTPLGPVSVVGAHLTRPWPFQYQWGQISQVMALTRRTRDLPRPLVVAGDFNSVSNARIGRQITADIGLHAAPGFPGTWPSRVPAWAGVTIDQVYLSEDLAFRSRRLGQSVGSDHRPVVTEITLAQGPRPR